MKAANSHWQLRQPSVGWPAAERAYGVGSLRTAIIDNGVNRCFSQLPSQLERWRVSGGQVLPYGDASAELNHGAVCAAILCGVNPDVAPVDIKALDGNGRAYISELCAALEWCGQSSIKLIHMSVGTANYHDCLALRPIVRELQASGKIIVAAFHNGGLPSWPAALPGVFGVRRDARSRLGSGEYAFAAGNGGLNAENRLVARYDAPLFTVGGEYVYTAAGNSFAAPVVTGHIASFLLERPDADFDGVLAYLQQNSRPVDVSEDGAREGLAAGKGASCPVMLFSEGDGALFADMVNMFRADGYKAEGFSDISDSDGTVPFRLYAKAGETINSGILFALEQVYKPDAMLFCLDKSRLGDTIDYSIVDAYIRRRGGAFVVNYDDHSECGHCTVDSLFAGLVGYFN